MITTTTNNTRSKLSIACLMAMLFAGSIYAKVGDTFRPFPQDSIVKVKAASKQSFEVGLKAGKRYHIAAEMRTESGADDVILSLEGLGRNTISLTTARANWTLLEDDFHTTAEQKDVKLVLSMRQTIAPTTSMLKNVVITETGDYTQVDSNQIPALPQRPIYTDMGVTMQPDSTVQWMRDARIGMFIHWGIYAGPARGEWCQENTGMTIEEYRKLAYPESGDLYFTAKDFDAQKWVDVALSMGAKYMNMVTQHHDGYALYESNYMGAFTSKQTHNRDFVKEYVDACRAAGLRVGLYKTLINWRFPGYYDIYGNDCKKNNFGYTTAAWHKEDARRMKEELYCQVRELMTNYGKIDQLYWDGGWISQEGSDADGAHFWESGQYQDNAKSQWPVNPLFQTKDKDGRSLGVMGMVRQLQPQIAVNPRCGWIGDYTCEEGGGKVNGGIRKGLVEKNFSIGWTWGYSPSYEDGEKLMSRQELIKIVADCMVRDMCALVNVGPDRHGNIPQATERRLAELGLWTHAMADAIYGTRGGPWEPETDLYGYTHKDDMLYVYFLGDYSEKQFQLPPMPGYKVLSAKMLGTGTKVGVSKKAGRYTLSGIETEKGEVTVVAVKLNRNIN